MSDPSPSRARAAQKHKSLLERLSAFIFREPENREELLEALHDAHNRDLLDADALSMIEGVLQVSELRARDLTLTRLTTHSATLEDVFVTMTGRHLRE